MRWRDALMRLAASSRCLSISLSAASSSAMHQLYTLLRLERPQTKAELRRIYLPRTRVNKESGRCLGERFIQNSSPPLVCPQLKTTPQKRREEMAGVSEEDIVQAA